MNQSEMNWLPVTQILTIILLLISELLGVAPVDINGIADALIKVGKELYGDGKRKNETSTNDA